MAARPSGGGVVERDVAAARVGPGNAHAVHRHQRSQVPERPRIVTYSPSPVFWLTMTLTPGTRQWHSATLASGSLPGSSADTSSMTLAASFGGNGALGAEALAGDDDVVGRLFTPRFGRTRSAAGENNGAGRSRTKQMPRDAARQ